MLAFLRWCTESGTTPELTRTTVAAFTAALLDAGAEPATARSRYMALRRFAAWLADEGEIVANPLINVKPPKLDTKVTAALSDDELKRLIKACQGREFMDVRDMAIVRLMAETGLRAGEVLGMTVSDVNPQGTRNHPPRQGWPRQGGALRTADCYRD